MPTNRPSRWVPSRRLRLGLTTSLLLALGGLTLLGLPSQAEPAPLQAQALAFFQADNKLAVAVTLADAQLQAAPGTLRVELVGAQGQIIAKAEQAVRPNVAGYRFELAADKAKASELSLRCHLGKQSSDVSLAKVLLLKGHETSLTAGEEFFAGSTAPFRCSVHGVRTATEDVPLSAAEVTVSLKDKDGKAHQLYAGKTGSDGRADGQLQVPALPSGQYTLEVVTRSSLGEEKLQQNVKLKDDAKILLLTDKPVYQPGQLIHLRALALRPFDLRPVENAALLFEVEDGKGNKVFKKSVPTSAYGIASADFQLADEVNMGDYQLHATIGQQKADKTVNVKRYVLPRCKVNVTADKKFYLPRETVKVELQSDYFFGKPLAGAKVEVAASTFDVQFKDFAKWQGKTDEQGHVKFEIQLPAYFVGQPLQQGNALVKLDLKVTDTADHTENIVKTYTVSDQPIRVNLIPEGGKLTPGLENRVFAAATYPDGSPAACTVKFWLGKEAKGEPLATVKTNDAGLAEFRFTPRAEQLRAGEWQQRPIEMLGGKQVGGGPAILLDMRAEAKDSQGSTATAAVTLNSHPLGENVLLRLNKAVYQVGDTLEADVRTSAGLPTVYLDIVRGGQILLSRWMEVKNGQATHKLDLPQNLFGSLEVHAYQMLHSGEIIRDSRVVYVQSRNDLKVEVKASKDVYTPGENGRIRFLVTDSAGRPTAAALGVIVVDEAVYALQELQPGLEKVYFTLQEELLKPQVEIKFQPQEALNDLVRQRVLPAAKQQVAEVLLTAVNVQPPARWQVAPDVQRKNQYDGAVDNLAWTLYRYAWFNDSALQYDEAKGRWTFSANLTDAMTKAGFIQPQQLEVPVAGQLTLAELTRTQKHFGAEQLARAITRHRMERLAAVLVQQTSANKDKWFQDGRWQLPALVLSEAAQKQGLDQRWLVDAWGQAFKLVRSEKKLANGTGAALFDHYDIVSAGPDRDFESGDDIRWTADSKQTLVSWWSASDHAPLNQNNPYAGLGRGGIEQHAQFGDRDGHRLLRDEMRRMDRREVAKNAAGFPPGMPMPMLAAANKGQGGPRGPREEAGDAKGGGSGASAAPARVREYFPETLLWQPNLITDDNGVADMAVNFADSITTWRLSASANSRGGALGGVTTSLKVFQDFFVDLDLPVALTQHDEVSFPVAVYNYLKTPQTVQIALQQEPWFELLDTAGLTRKLDLKPNEVTAVHFRIRANRIGNQPLTVKANGSKMSDAVKRVIEVVPNGQRFEKVVSDRLNGTITQNIEIPQDALPDASKLMVRIYPGVMAQVVDGLEGMMRMPGGCFEQTSSSAYPNIMIVDYIKKTKQTSPQLLLKAEQYLNVGYQRLLTFERPGGGFDWWGSGEPLIWLSAYGLQEFNDMARVYPIDRGIIDRTQKFLLNKRDQDGTWSNIGATHSETIANMGNPKLLLTSYVTWSLLESGLPKDQVKQSIEYIRGHVKDAGESAYVLSLAANALAAYDANDDSTLEVLHKLDKHRHELPEWKAANFPTPGQSLTYARGDNVAIETTALTVLAMTRTGRFTTSVNKALTYLVKAKQGNGTWGSTQATILALRALLSGMSGSQLKGRIDFTILVNGKEAARGEVTAETADVMQAFDLKEHTQLGVNDVTLKVSGETSLMYQIVGRYYQPWKQDVQPTVKSGFEIDVAYDRTKLATNDLLHAKATVKYNGTLPACMVMVDLGIAPGFTVDAGDFAEMVAKKQISKFSVTSRQIILYLNDLRAGESRTFEYSLRARFPLRAQTPASVTYEYYTPGNRAVARPTELVVTDRK